MVEVTQASLTKAKRRVSARFLPMRIVLAVLLLFAAAEGLAAVLVVGVDGEVVWADSARKEGDKLVFVPQGGGEALTMPMAKVNQIIPRIKRGKRYTQREVAKVLKAIDKCSREFRTLRKVLKPLELEWP